MATFGNYFFFPLSFEQTGAGRGYRTAHTAIEGADRFDARQENGLWKFQLGGLKILASHIDDWDAFHDAVKGQWLPFLFRLQSKRFEIAREQSGGIGTGDGVQTAFQLVKRRSYAYGPANQSVEKVRFPLHDYPEMRVPLGNASAGPILYPAGERLRIWVNGVERLTGWSVNRETGVVTFDVAPIAGALVEAACRFFVLVHGQDSFDLSMAGGVWTFGNGAELFQVASEAT